MPDEEPLLDVDRLDEIVALLGDELPPLLEESITNLSRNLALLEHDGTAIADFGRAAHAIASSSLQLGLRALGLRARQLEASARTLDAAARIADVGGLRALADRSTVALRAHLAQSR
jgi:HPt (histidine-containing phosphotransfer) domain-containing protein